MLRTFTLLSLLAVPASAIAAPVWSSNFESGTLADWTKIQTVAEDRVRIVTDPVREGQKALKVTVNHGDDPIRSGNDRAELIYMSLEPTGTEYFYRWSVLFPANYPSHEKWQLFAQWHQEGLGGSPPFEMFVAGEQMHLRTGGHDGPVLWKAPLERGRWHDFILHVKWSSDPNVGFVEMHHNGELVLPRTPTATQLPGQLNYFKLGLYRSRAIKEPATVYFDDVRMGTDLSDVMAPPSGPGGQAVASGPGGGQGAIGPGDLDGDGEISTEELQAQMAQSGCSASGFGGTLPVLAGMTGLVLLGVARRGRAARVTAPAHRPDRRR